jgi:hypothetical protein
MYEAASKVGSVKATFFVFFMILVMTGLLSSLAGCAVGMPHPSSLAQAADSQGALTTQTSNTPQPSEPITPEMFSAFLDRG